MAIAIPSLLAVYHGLVEFLCRCAVGRLDYKPQKGIVGGMREQAPKLTRALKIPVIKHSHAFVYLKVQSSKLVYTDRIKIKKYTK